MAFRNSKKTIRSPDIEGNIRENLKERMRRLLIEELGEIKREMKEQIGG